MYRNTCGTCGISTESETELETCECCGSDDMQHMAIFVSDNSLEAKKAFEQEKEVRKAKIRKENEEETKRREKELARKKGEKLSSWKSTLLKGLLGGLGIAVIGYGIIKLLF